MDQDGLKPTQPPSGADLTGMRVEGFIDGAFDTGYFMTVRVNGQTLRGMLYREDACMPPSVNTPRAGDVFGPSLGHRVIDRFQPSVNVLHHDPSRLFCIRWNSLAL